MRKIFFYLLLLCIAFQSSKAQEIHSLPTSVFYPNEPNTPSNSVAAYYEILGNLGGPPVHEILSHIEALTNHMDESFESTYKGDLSVYYSRRVLAHIELYYYFDRDNQPDKMLEQLTLIETYLQKLVLRQCINVYPSNQNDCDPLNPYHGGFPFKAYDDDGELLALDNKANPRTTAIALLGMLEARNFYLNLNTAHPQIPCAELEDRIQQAKDALYTYEEFNNQYLNLSAFAFITANAHSYFYNDINSKDFLIEKGSEMVFGTAPLRPNSSNAWSYNSWTYDWQEGQQLDGSWKDYGRDVPSGQMPRSYNECEKWHNSELDYHSVIMEGLARLHSSLESGPLKDETRIKLINSINHIIDYNGEVTPVQYPFNSNVIASYDNPNTAANEENLTAFQNTRLSRSTRVGKYHRETSSSECNQPGPNGKNFGLDPGTLNKRVVGIGLLRSLIVARNTLNLSSIDQNIIDNIIKVLPYEIIKSVNNIPEEQLYDLSLYLNRDYLDENRISPLYTKDKLIVAFDNDIITAFHENNCENVQRVEDFYTGTQTVQEMIAGDFNGDGEDELIAAYIDNKGIYRFQKNISGNLAISGRLYNGSSLTTAMAVGNFNNGNKDQLIVAFENGEIHKYEEDPISAEMTLIEIFYSNSISNVVAMETIDFNETGKDQLIVAFDNGNISKFHESNGNIVFLGTVPNLRGSTTFYVDALEVGDFNGDNKEELIMKYNTNSVSRYKEYPTVLKESIITGNITQITSIAVGNFNQDTKDELIIASDNNVILRYQENNLGELITNLPTDVVYSGSQIAINMEVGDFDDDTIDELIVSFDGTYIYRCYEKQDNHLKLRETVYTSGIPTNKLSVLKRENSYSGRSSNVASIKKKMQPQPTVNAYPNPTNDFITINSSEVYTNYLVYSIEGKLIQKGSLQNNQKIDLSSIQSGLYFLKLDGDTILKIIKK